MINLLISLVIGAGCGWLVTQLMKLDSSNMIFNCFLGSFYSIIPPCQNGFLVLPYDQFLQNQVSRIRFSASIQPPARHLYRTPQFFAHESQKGVPIALKTSA